jgi:hypothetical protein
LALISVVMSMQNPVELGDFEVAEKIEDLAGPEVD